MAVFLPLFQLQRNLFSACQYPAEILAFYQQTFGFTSDTGTVDRAGCRVGNRTGGDSERTDARGSDAAFRNDSGAEHSHAGQYLTRLGVTGPDEAIDAIHACWASAHDARAAAYRAHRGHDAPVAMAVIVQRLAAGEASGVGMTCDPVTGDAGTIVVNATWGLGELLVSGPSSALMYWNNRAQSRRTFMGEWTRSGDKYMQDEEGYFVYCGRNDDMMKVSGLYVSPFEVEGALFLSDKGDLTARIEGSYDQRITQRLILQPMAEMNFAAQDVPASGIGAGLSDVELGLRLRYEIVREFAPYVGVEWARKVGGTARYARADGDDADSVSLVAGIKLWF